MKNILAALGAFTALSALPAAEPALTFGDTRLAVPPLSLRDSARAGGAGPWKFSGPSSVEPAQPPVRSVLSPNLVPRFSPSLAEARAAAQKQREAPRSRLPVVAPRSDIDFQLKVQTPDPSVDFKLRLKEPAGAATK